MRSRHLATQSILVLLGATSLLAPALAAPNPLAPLTGFQTNLLKGMNAVVKGKAAAFGSINAVAKQPMGPQIAEAGVASVQLMGTELELIYFEAGKPSYYVRTAVAPTRQGPAFAVLQGRKASEGRLFVKPYPIADYKGPAAPLAAAARQLIKVLAGKDCTKVPLATAADFGYLVSPISERATRDMERTRAGLEQQCKIIGALKPSKVELRVDDVVYAGLDKDGKMVAVLRAKLSFEGGKLTLEYGSIRKNPRAAKR